jgi:hypothetical protein
MQIGKAFAFIFDDKSWFNKIIIGMIITLVPILNLAWGGYTNEIIRRVAKDDYEPLPGWDNLGKKFVEGLMLAVAVILYALPVFLATGLWFVPVVSVTSTGSTASEIMTQATAGLGILVACLVFIYVILLTFLVPAAQINFALKGNFAALFQIGAIFRIFMHNPGRFVLAWLGYILVTVVVSALISILTPVLFVIVCLGWIVLALLSAIANPYIQCVYAHLFGQVAAGQEAQ